MASPPSLVFFCNVKLIWKFLELSLKFSKQFLDWVYQNPPVDQLEFLFSLYWILDWLRKDWLLYNLKKIFFKFFLVWTIFKVFIQFATILLPFYVLLFLAVRHVGFYFPSQGPNSLHTPCIAMWGVNQWATRKVPDFLLISSFSIQEYELSICYAFSKFLSRFNIFLYKGLMNSFKIPKNFVSLFLLWISWSLTIFSSSSLLL